MTENDRNAADRCEECGGQLTQPNDAHRQVSVIAGGIHAHVDAGLADLIVACWTVAIVTLASCEGDPNTGLAYIAFGPGSAERFVGAATLEDLDSSPDGVLGWRIRAIENYPGAWRWVPCGLTWGTSFVAHFPASDIPELTRRLELWG